MEKLEMWDYICMGTMLLCLWMGTYGLKMCRDANKEATSLLDGTLTFYLHSPPQAGGMSERSAEIP